jgi:Oxidoreductase family, NAD-binding Rossmann fold
MGLVGPGFSAAQHLSGVRRLGNVDIVAVAGSTAESLSSKARRLGVSRAYGSYRELMPDPDIDVIHNTTPNYMHYPIAITVLEAGNFAEARRADYERCAGDLQEVPGSRRGHFAFLALSAQGP